MLTVTTTTTTNTTGVEPNPSWHILIPHIHTHTYTHTHTHTHTNTHTPHYNSLRLPVSSFQSCLTCSAPVPVHHSSHPRLSVRCNESSSRFCPSLPPSGSLTLPPSPLPNLALSPSLSCSPVAHAAETLYLIHYNTSRLTPSQMGGWLLLVLAN